MARSRPKPILPQAATAHFEPRSPSQRLAQRLYASKDLIFLLGPAGSGKTLTAVALAAMDVLSDSCRKKIISVRPAVQADRELGFLKGDLQEKLAPYTVPIRQNLDKVAFRFPAERLEFEALGYTRGVTWDDCIVILDEAQNATYRQLLLVISRLGEGSKLLITGDPEQADVVSTGDYQTDLEEIVERLEQAPGVGVVDFPENECHRHPVLKTVLPKLIPRRK